MLFEQGNTTGKQPSGIVEISNNPRGLRRTQRQKGKGKANG
jgi:hypothetical protein